MREAILPFRPFARSSRITLLIAAVAATVATFSVSGYELLQAKFAQDRATQDMFEVGEILSEMNTAGQTAYNRMMDAVARPGTVDLDQVEAGQARANDLIRQLGVYAGNDPELAELFETEERVRGVYLVHERRIVELLREGRADEASEYMQRADYQADAAAVGGPFGTLITGMQNGTEAAYERSGRRELTALMLAGGGMLVIAVLWGAILVDWVRQTRVAQRQSIEAQRARAELADMNNELERRVQERTRELEDARVRAEAANKAKSEFLASMSHELRTPLNGVLGMSTVLAATPLEDNQKSMVRVIDSSGRSLLVLLNDVLDYARLEAGKLEIRSEPFDMTETLERVIALYGHEASKKKLALRLEVTPDATGAFIGDETRLGQVVGNLVSNAVKFTDAGSVCVQAVHDGERARIAVADTGCGIDASMVETIFERFSQGDSSSRRRHGGVGLGLALARELVAAMGGTIGVETTPGAGARFWLEIPLARWKAAGASADIRAA